jgi:hypothetical protein
MFSVDPIFVQYCSDGKDTGYYVAAGTLGRALCAFTGPVATVMFAKIVRNSALSGKSNYMGLTLVITAVMAAIGAFGLSVIAPWLVPKFMYKPEYTAALPLLPWFSAAMVPLALSNVLLNNFLARGRFTVVPWVALVAVGYAAALFQWGTSTFTVSGFKDAAALTAKLEQPTDPLSTFLHSKLSDATAMAWTNYRAGGTNLTALQASLEPDINAVIEGGSIYEPQRFASVEISPKTQRLLDQHPQGGQLIRLNRLLLEDAYPDEMAKSHSGTFIAIIQTLCVFNLLFLGVLGVFAWRESRSGCARAVAPAAVMAK